MQKPIVAIVGADTLLGREVRDVLESRRLGVDLRLLGTAEGSAALLAEQEGEAVVLAPLDREQLADTRLVLLAGTPASSRRALRLAGEAERQPALVDLTHALEEHPDARLRAPQAEPAAELVSVAAIQVIAHPAAVALALLLRTLHRAFPLSRLVVQLFEPASERGQRGLDELQQQTISLLSFRPLNQDVFDAQLAFNMLPRLGQEAPTPLEDVEVRIDRHLASLLAGEVPMPSLRLTQAPVFHGYSASVWMEFEEGVPELAALEEALRHEHIEVRVGEETLPNNVDVAGESGIVVGAMESDRNNPRALWLWMTADNLRLAATTTALVVRRMLETAA